MADENELEKVDWNEVSKALTNTLRETLRENFKGNGGPLAEQIVELSEVTDYANFGSDAELPPLTEGPLGEVEEKLRKQLAELLLSRDVSKQAAFRTMPLFLTVPFSAQATNCTTVTSPDPHNNRCKFVTTRCHRCS